MEATEMRDSDYVINNHILTSYDGTDADVVVPKGVTVIGRGAFETKAHVRTVTLPEGLRAIDEGAFEECPNLEQIHLPEGLASIGKHAFNSATSLRSVTLPASVTKVGSFAFCNCTSLAAVHGGTGLVEINSAAFQHCMALRSVTLPAGLRTIGIGAFAGSGLTALTIPAAVTEIGRDFVTDCQDLRHIAVEAGNPVYHSAGDCLIETDTRTLFAGCAASTIPADGSVTGIEDEAFRYLTDLTAIDIPASVEVIGSNAFANCTSLRNVTLHNGLIQIGESAFAGCTALTEVCVPRSVQWIGQDAFRGCKALRKLTVRGKLDSVSKTAFLDCPNLREFDWPIAPHHNCIFRGNPRAPVWYILSGFNDDGRDAAAFYWLSKANREPIEYARQYVLRNKDDLLLRLVQDPDLAVLDALTSRELGATYSRPLLLYAIEQAAGNVALKAALLNYLHTAYPQADEDAAALCRWDSDANGKAATKAQAACVFAMREDDDGYRLTHYLGHDGNVVVPGHIEGKRVTPGRGLLRNREVFTVVLEDGVTEIDAEAFADCRSLTMLTLPRSLRKIGRDWLEGCNKVDIYYAGTRAEWEKTDLYFSDVHLCVRVIHCTDGDYL